MVPEFRAWHVKEQRYYYDSFAIHPNGVILKLDDNNRSVIGGYLSRDFILEQYTGKEDKNGKKIFEGHRVKVHGHEYNVIFNERMTSFDIATTGNGIGFYNSKDIEITGTIHDK